jgi:Ran GTPase-activating protein 1
MEVEETMGGKLKIQLVDLADVFTGRLISEIPQALSALCDALKDHTSLVELDLSDNAFGGRCADAMVPFLTTNTNFQNFRLNNNGLGPIGGKIIADAIASNADLCKKQGKASSLRVIICGRNRLENGSAGNWAKAFEKHGKLREVRMIQNGIRMEGIEAIAKGLSKCPTLEILDLQDNTATRSGTRALVKVLPSWPDLRILNLSDCILSSAGGIALGTALSSGTNPKLEELRLQYGEFDKRTVELLATAITQHLSNLTVLELNGNKFEAEDECVEKLKEALAIHGHEDALDECEHYFGRVSRIMLTDLVEDMEEADEDEEDEVEDEAGDDEDEDEDDKVTYQEEDGVADGESGDVIPPVSDKAADE